MTAAPSGRSRTALWLALCSALVGLAALVWTKLALPAAGLALLAAVTGGLTTARVPTVVAGVIAVVAVTRFIVQEAMPGLVQGGNRAAGMSAVSRLREISFAQDVLRQKAFVDPDADGVGSAALLGELAGKQPVRGLRVLDPPPLHPRYGALHDTPLGPAANVGGYFFIVCLPRVGGGLTADPKDPIDDEAAERRFVAYGWPAVPGGPSEVYFIDEHERILVSDNRQGNEPRYSGPFHPPPCDAALEQGSDFTPWRGKKPRQSLPGAR
ncbi:MAG: hypothetical protein KF718_07095 [Polyangiaceae bacterium]|nr:hypothetical protein [Polyangiaceae bacterium]